MKPIRVGSIFSNLNLVPFQNVLSQLVAMPNELLEDEFEFSLPENHVNIVIYSLRVVRQAFSPRKTRGLFCIDISVTFALLWSFMVIPVDRKCVCSLCNKWI